MPSITTGLAFRLPSFSFFRSSSATPPPSESGPSAPAANPTYLTFQWSSSVHLRRTNAGFEAPVRIPWQEKLTYKFVVDGRWTVNDAEPTEYDHSGFINNVYTAPPKPAEPQPEPQPEPQQHEPSEHEHSPTEESHTESGSETTAVELEHPVIEKSISGDGEEAREDESVAGAINATVGQFVGKLHEAIVVPAVEFASTLDAPYEAPTPTTEVPPTSVVDEVKEAIAPAIQGAQEAVADVAPVAEEVQPREAEVRHFHPAPSILLHRGSLPPSLALPLPSPQAIPTASTPKPEPPLRAPIVAMDIVPILPPQSSSPETDVLRGTAVNPPHAMEHEVTPSTHTPAPLADSASPTGAPASTQDALESTAATDAPATAVEDTSAAVPTAAAEAPVVEVNKPTTEPAPETAPHVLAAEPISEDVAPKEVIPAEPTAAVETAAAAVPVDIPTSAIEEAKGEEKVAAPEVLAAQPAGEEVKEVVPVEDKAGVGEPVAVGINTAAPTEETKPEEAIAAVSAPHTAPETAPANPVGTEEAFKDLVPESAATEQLPKELVSEPAAESTQGATTSAPVDAPEAKPSIAQDSEPAEPTPTAVTIPETTPGEPTPAPAPESAEPTTSVPAADAATAEPKPADSQPAANGVKPASFPKRNGTLMSKKERPNFPSESGESTGSTPSRFSSLRRKRTSSIFGKIKGIFGGDKEKEKVSK